MTQGDIQELITLACLFGLASFSLIRNKLFLALFAMSINMVLGRIFIVYFEAAYLLCSALQLFLAVLIVGTAQTRLSLILGGLYAGMVIGGGATSLGYLSPETGIGLSLTYWSVMSVLTYFQFVAVFMAWADQKYGMVRGRLTG